MEFVDTAKTKLFGDQNNRQDHGFRAGFVPTIAPSLVVAGAVAMGAPAGAVALALAGAGAVFAAAGAEKNGYNAKRYLAGMGAGGALGAALVFNVTAGHLPQEQPKAPVAGPVPSTLEIKPSGGSLCEDFKIADSEMTDKQGRKVYTLFVPQDCSLVPNP